MLIPPKQSARERNEMFSLILRAIDCCNNHQHLETVKENYAEQLNQLKEYDEQSPYSYFKLYQAIMEKFSDKANQLQQEMEFLCLFNRPLN